MEISLLVAFGAGLISFLAPCLVPLLPAYISYISGVSLSELNSGNTFSYRRKILLNSLLYMAGFSLVFVLLGLGASSVGRILIDQRLTLLRLGGLLIIFFGLSMLGVFDKLTISQKEFHLSLPQRWKKIKYLGPFLIGNTFALAWTPCVGVILGSILSLAATSQNLAFGALLLFFYSLGISLPFLLVALTLGSSFKLISKSAPNLHKFSNAFGLLLILIGVLMVSQKYDYVSGFLRQFLLQFDFYQNLQDLILHYG